MTYPMHAQDAVLEYLLIENGTQTKYRLIESVNLNDDEESDDKWMVLTTIGPFDTLDDARETRERIRAHRPDATLHVISEVVTSTQKALALVRD